MTKAIKDLTGAEIRALCRKYSKNEDCCRVCPLGVDGDCSRGDMARTLKIKDRQAELAPELSAEEGLRQLDLYETRRISEPNFDMGECFFALEKAVNKAKAYDELFADMPSNTINDFHEDTADMLGSMLDLYETKLLDAVKEGSSITKTALMEKMGFAHRYVASEAAGWQKEEKK